MIYEIKGRCEICAEEYKIIISDSNTFGICPDCGEQPIKFKKFKGMVYVISNPNQGGVKVGLTSKDIDSRVKQLNTTGVVGKFSKIAVFPSDRPEKDEKKAHDKLKKYKWEKEHFDLSPTEAVLKIYRALNYREPIFYDKGIEREFMVGVEEARKKMQKQLGN
jgi:ssDNA-binding Zn-finger/Zn-ribbon topoisomerase 1